MACSKFAGSSNYVRFCTHIDSQMSGPIPRAAELTAAVAPPSNPYTHAGGNKHSYC